MSDKTKIRSAYNGMAHSYDDMISLRKWWARLGVKFVWGFHDTAYSGRLLDNIPDDFNGTLLDIPTGTGALTVDKYSRLRKAKITCTDYSENMLSIAKERYARIGISNVIFQQADVGALQFESGAFDAILTMNGLHAFPDKKAALGELLRVLKTDGALIGCCYIRGEVKRTDWIVRNIYTPKGFFTPPFWNRLELEDLLKGLFANVEIWTIGAIAWFRCNDKF